MSNVARHGVFVRMFGSAIMIQALLSMMNFFVGLVLIRRTSDTQYGYYVLVSNATMLVSGLQNAFIQPALVLRLVDVGPAERADLVGRVFSEQRFLLGWVTTVLMALTAGLWLAGILQNQLALLIACAIAAVSATLYRDCLRMVLMIDRRSHDVLKAEACYGLLVVCAVPLATLSSNAAAIVALILGLAAVLSSVLMSRFLWRYEPWNTHTAKPVLRTLAPIGSWSAAGSATHWAFSQGYNYLVAAVLDLPSVAALAGTRLFMMPINLLSSGITSLMMPTASNWLHAHGPAKVFRRLLLVTCALSALASCYLTLLWLTRSLLFAHVLHKDFPHLDGLLQIWSAVFLVTIFRDQLQYLPGACGLYRHLTVVTAVSAAVSLSVGYAAIRHIGALGAPLGVLAGELVNVLGIVSLSLRQIRHSRAVLATSQ